MDIDNINNIMAETQLVPENTTTSSSSVSAMEMQHDDELSAAGNYIHPPPFEPTNDGSLVLSAHNNDLMHDAELAANATQTAYKGTPMNEVRAFSYDAVKQDLVSRYSSEHYQRLYPKLANELAKASTPNELWKTLNTRERTHAPLEDLDHMRQLYDQAEKDGTLERMKKEAEEKYSVVDPETGNKVLADFNNPAHMEQLQERMNVFVHKALSDDQVAEMQQAAQYKYDFVENSPNDTIREEFANRVLPKLNHTQAERYRRTGKLPKKYEAELRAFREQMRNMTMSALNTFNAIVTAEPNEAQIVQLKAKSVPFSAFATQYFPLTTGVRSEALTMFAYQSRMGLVMWNTLPTLLYESKLRLIMFGQKTYRVTTSYNYHQCVHSMFLWALQTNVRPNHEQFLEEEQARCHAQEESAKKDRDEFRAQLASGELEESNPDVQHYKAQIDKSFKELAIWAGGIARARKAWAEEKKIVSPFINFLENPNEELRWAPMRVPRHSKDEIVQFVDALREQEVRAYDARLKALEAAYTNSPVYEHEDEYRQVLRNLKALRWNVSTRSDSEVETLETRLSAMETERRSQNVFGAREFLREYWLLCHLHSVNYVKTFEVGLLLLFENAIPSSYRADFAMRVDTVPNKVGLVRPEVVQKLREERRFFHAIRQHYSSVVNEHMQRTPDLASQVTSNGVALALFDEMDGMNFVAPDEAVSPTYAEVYEHYQLVTTDYGSVQNVVKIGDVIEYAYANIYDGEGRLFPDYEKRLHTLELQYMAAMASSSSSNNRKNNSIKNGGGSGAKRHKP